MVSIFELTYRYVLPSVRRALVNELRKLGMSQNEIAETLKLDHSAISRYLSAERGNLIDLSIHEDVHGRITGLAYKIKENNLTFYDIYLEIYKLVLYVLAKKYVCKLHMKLDPWLNPNECYICPTLFQEF